MRIIKHGEILDRLLAQTQHQGHSRSSIFAELLPVLQSLRDSQVVAHVSPRWVVVEPVESTSVQLSDENQYAENSEQDDESKALIIQHASEESLDTGFTNKAGKTTEFTFDSKQENISYVVKAPLDFPIEILKPNFSIRAYHGLKRAGINTIEALQTWSNEDLLSLKNFGQKSLDEVQVALANFQPPPQSVQTQKVIQLPEWANLPGLQIHTRCVSLSSSLRKIVSKYPTIAHLIYDFEDGGISLDSRHYAELKVVLAPFQALRNALQGYLDWLASLSSLTLIEVLTKHQWTPNKLKELSPRQILSTISLDARATTHQAIISGEIPSKRFASIAEEIDDCFFTLDDKQKFVLKQRLGLSNGKPRSLEDIGQELGLTRERVRQIEQKAKNRLDDISNEIFLQLRQIAIETLQSIGCISTIPNWCEDIAELYPPGEVDLQSVVAWLVDLVTGFHSIQVSETQLFYKAPVTSQVLEDIQAQIVDFWKEQRISDRAQLHQVILPLLPEQISNPEKVADVLITAFCYEPLPSLFSAEKWNVTDYAFYVLYEAGKRLHFSEIGQRIKQLKPDWKAENIEKAAQGAVERHPDIIRSGSGVYALREWGTMEYSHFREVLLDYLSKQPLPVEVEDIYAKLSQSYSVSFATVSMNLSLHPYLFKKFGRSNFYGVAKRSYELPDQNLVNLLVAKLESGPVSLFDLEQDANLEEYGCKTIYMYLNISTLFCQTASINERIFGLSIEGKRHYKPGDASKIVEEIFNQIREPLHARDFVRFICNYYAYPPGEAAFWRTLTENEDYLTITEGKNVFIARKWLTDENFHPILEDLDRELFGEIILFSLGYKRKQQHVDILFDWLNFCYRNHFFYRGSLVYAQINLSELSDKKAQIARKIGQVCQRNGDISVLTIGQDASSEEVDRTLRLDLEDLRQQAQSGQRTPSKGLASKPDGRYRVRYVGVCVEVHITKWGGTDNACARVLQVFVNGETFDPSRHNPIPTNTATLDQRREALQKLYAVTLTAYAQVDPYLQEAIGPRPSWGGIGYCHLEPLTEPKPGDAA